MSEATKNNLPKSEKNPKDINNSLQFKVIEDTEKCCSQTGE